MGAQVGHLPFGNRLPCRFAEGAHDTCLEAGGLLGQIELGPAMYGAAIIQKCGPGAGERDHLGGVRR